MSNKEELSMNERLKLSGIETIRVPGTHVIELQYKDKIIKRPHVQNCVEYCLIEFGVEI